MLVTIGPDTIDSPVAPEFDALNPPDVDAETEAPQPEFEEAAALDEPWFDPGAWGLRSDGGRKAEDDDEDSDYGFDDDFEDDDADDDEEDDALEEEFEDEEADDDLDDFEDEDV